MHVTDAEMGLAMGFASRMRQDQRAAQQVVAGRDAEIARLRRRIAQLERVNAQLKSDRTARHRALLLESLARH